MPLLLGGLPAGRVSCAPPRQQQSPSCASAGPSGCRAGAEARRTRAALVPCSPSAAAAPHPDPGATHHHRCRFSRVARRAQEPGSSASRDSSLDDYLEVKVDQVRINNGQAVVYLRILSSARMLLVHIGENESNALLKEINKQRQMRPLTHDVMRNILKEINFRVIKIRITDIVANTYYARIHLARLNGAGQVEPDSEVDVDARPSDAINLAVRFGAPMYVNKRIAEVASTLLQEPVPQSESSAEIVRSVRDTLASFEDPTVMYQLQKELAVKEERFEDAGQLQKHIYHEMTHNQLLRLVVAMESALGDGRYEEAARLRDEFKKLAVNPATSEQRL